MVSCWTCWRCISSFAYPRLLLFLLSYAPDRKGFFCALTLSLHGPHFGLQSCSLLSIEIAKISQPDSIIRIPRMNDECKMLCSYISLFSPLLPHNAPRSSKVGREHDTALHPELVCTYSTVHHISPVTIIQEIERNLGTAIRSAESCMWGKRRYVKLSDSPWEKKMGSYDQRRAKQERTETVVELRSSGYI